MLLYLHLHLYLQLYVDSEKRKRWQGWPAHGHKVSTNDNWVPRFAEQENDAVLKCTSVQTCRMTSLCICTLIVILFSEEFIRPLPTTTARVPRFAEQENDSLHICPTDLDLIQTKIC